MDQVIIGVIGTGFWGSNHSRVFSELPNVELQAVCDVDKERAKGVAERYQVPTVYSNYNDLLRDNSVDAVTVCTPSITHGKVATAALQAGKDVLIEKPMAVEAREAKRIMNRARRLDNIVSVGFIERFNPVVQKMKDMLEEGQIGEVLLSYARRIGSWPERIGDVGVVRDTAVHDIDLATHMFNHYPKAVFARGGKLQHHKFMDYVQATLVFPHSKTALVEANWLTPRKKREMQVTGTSGVIKLNFLAQEVSIEKMEYEITPTVKFEEPLKLELSHFATCVQKRSKPLVTVEDGYRATVIAEAIINSVRHNRAVKLKAIRA